MKWWTSRRDFGLVSSLGLLIVSGACHNGELEVVGGALVFSSPDEPTELAQPDAGVVQIAFGDVRVGSSKSMTLAFASLGSPVTLGTVTAIQPDSEFSLPFVTGAVVGPVPDQITVSFAPTSSGAKSAVFQLIADSPGTRDVLFELSGLGVPNGLSVVPNPVNFGDVEINQSQSLALTVTNNSPLAESVALSTLQGQNTERFNLGAPSSTSLDPGQSATLDVAFTPLVNGAASAFFTVSPVSAGDPIMVNLAGTGVDSWIRVTSPLEFGFVQLGDTVVKSAVFTNAGSYMTLHLVAPAPTVTQPSGAMAFSLASTAPAVPLAIPPGQSILVPIAFAPPALDEYTGTLFVTTDDPLNEYPAVQLDGYGGGPHISCQPLVTFSPAQVGTSEIQDAVCYNDGTTIPSHPALALQIAQKDLGADNPAFIPTLILPDGGLASSGDSVALLTAQRAKIAVAFLPVDAGVFRNRLTVPSNDINDLDAGSLLVGQGGLTLPCNLQVIPAELSFGEVPPGGIGILQFEVTNVSPEFCTVSHVGLDPDSDSAFSLPGDLGAQVLSFPGNPDNPSGLPSSVVLEVEFAPTSQASAAVGKIDVVGVNAIPPDQSISVIGVSQPACLSIEPGNLDFGVVAFSPTNLEICAPDNASVMARNECTLPVTVSQIAINSGFASMPQFELQSGLRLPLILAPGGQASFGVSFVPTSPGIEFGAITVTSSEFPTDPFLITLQGDAELTGKRTDAFTVPALKQVDLLWILDEDDDAPLISTVGFDVLPQLIGTMNQDQINYQIAVTSTDTCDAGSSDRGFLEPCDHCLSSASSSPSFISPTTPNAAAALLNLFELFDIDPQIGLCRSVNGDEHFFDSIADAFSPDLLSGHNSGFIRDGAYLAVVVVNDDAEDDANDSAVAGPYLTSLTQVTALVEGLKPDPSMVSVSYLNSGAGALGAAQKIGQLVEATGGIEIDSKVDNWQTLLLEIFAFTEGVGAFRLTSTPASSDQIQVDVNGMPTTAWTYDPNSNQVIFTPGQIPPPGATVTVTYELGCP